MRTNTFHKTTERFESLKNLLTKSKDFGIDSDQLIIKIDSIINAMNDKELRVVLMGSFSDGKTSVIAGLLGQLKTSMKIDQDESSDDLVFYHFDGIDNIVIIDTPGLFGTKEKEINGVNIQYSEITKKFISEANIVIYVCDAVTPLKESHVETIRRVLRDYNKLKATIFVLNKMDEAGIDMLDPDDYNHGVIIKKNALVTRLKDTMALTDEEANQLHIACIAADPKGKGLDYWFNEMNSYKERSHISLLEDSITEIVEKSDIEELKNDTNLAVITDVISDVQEQLNTVIDPVERATKQVYAIHSDLSQDCMELRKDLIAAKGRLLEDLFTLSTSIKTDIEEADQASINNIIENKLGIVDGRLDYNILDARIEQTITNCVESNNYVIKTKVEDYCNKMNLQETIVKDALKKGAGYLGKVKITNTQILNARNFLGQYFKWAKNIKFKPHGAGKLATKITKGAFWAGNAINLGLDIIGYFKDKKEEKKFLELKETIKSDISAKFKDLFEIINSDDNYINEFAPSYVELCKMFEQRNTELMALQNQIEQLEQYKSQINDCLICVKQYNKLER